MFFLLSACGSGHNKFTEAGNDAPRREANITEPATIINMPDGFSNVATRCYGSNGVYVIFHQGNPYGSIAVVPNDPECQR